MELSTRAAIKRGTSEALAAASLPENQLFINGSFVPGASGDSFTVVDPSTGKGILEIPRASVEEVDQAVLAAKEAFTEWGRILPSERAAVLLKIADRLEEHQAELMALESLNTGKPSAVAEDDVSSAIDSFRFMAGALRSGTSLSAGEYAKDHLSMIVREPLGVIGAVTPWNYPLLMGVWKIAPILAAGNTLVLKPSETTPLSTLKFAQLTADLLPAGVFNVLTGKGSVIGTRLSEHPEVAMVALTGSVGSGISVASVAAQSVKRVHLELGGKAPVVVFEDADIEAAVAGIRSAGYWNSGQECGAACRVLVHESIAGEFTRRLGEAVSSLVVGEPGAGDEVEIGPMISKAHYDRVLEHLEKAKAEGASFVTGGGAMEGPGYFIEPTVIDAPQGASCTQEEIFGPVVSVETFSTEQDALDRANEVPFGLAASVWTKDAQRSHFVASRLDAGTVWVNSHLALATEMPWGGFKGSGYGRDLSAYAIDDYSRTKHVMHHTGR
ncbi:aminobutyraldehyde dehydrogenase [Glutamicibacter nicotianae]|uniref:Gamma-aminobutyraldehyde dehydrogenase n=1 Tax=Glutamicibacter nicotianae TaxID=37929 RepID=A0ABQ0RI73_GLUNI|nr:aminobutyraldehyde dehydrogenase [Glutamicibacter nicotianae]GEC11524.1 gamma-aminobutyraldehyde dehydrogenase [Glutamicibacter nicotianae]